MAESGRVRCTKEMGGAHGQAIYTPIHKRKERSRESETSHERCGVLLAVWRCKTVNRHAVAEP